VATFLYGEFVQGAVDEYVDKVASNFSMKAMLIEHKASPKVAMRVGEKLCFTVLDVKAAVDEEDEQVIEAYSQWSKPKLKKFLEFLQGMLKDCMDHGKVVKAMRKPRVSKKPKASPVAKLRYLQRDMELNLASINPEEILGADEFYAYRSGTARRFIYYKAKAGETLSIQGQTVQGYDEELSGAKTIRKPHQLFENINFGRKAIRETFDKVNSSKGAAPARISDDVILLKAYK
jgi:hypothetical protein